MAGGMLTDCPMRTELFLRAAKPERWGIALTWRHGVTV